MRNSPAQRKIGGIDFPAGWGSRCRKMRPVRAVEIFCIALNRARKFMGDFLPSALRWAVTRRPYGAIGGMIITIERFACQRIVRPSPSVEGN
ncbi:MAG: hypothetical protein LBP75_09040 [Planctomycetota bacterium]|nr:hypothetical protein [Planctomycetota bacterium]